MGWPLIGVLLSEPGTLTLMGLVLFGCAFLARRIGAKRDEGSLRSARWYFRHALAAQPKRVMLIPPPMHPAQREFLRRAAEVESERVHP